MNFFVVPAMLYQQKQKIKQNPKKSGRSSGHGRKSGDKSDAVSIHSSLLADQRSSSSSANSNAYSKDDEKEPNSSDKSRRRSESSQLGLPLLSSRRASLVSETSRHSSAAGLLPSFTLAKNPFKSAEKPFIAEKKEPLAEQEIPHYVAFTDTSIFNSEEGLRKTFLNPGFAIKRFEAFLDIIADHHVNDPINFATVRDQSLSKFLSRRNVGLTSHWSKMLAIDRGDRQRIEDLLSHELLKCRSIMRSALKLQLKHQSCYRKLACEQLIQGNFVNYVRYVLMLPECSPMQAQTLDEFQKKDYEVKRAFADMAEALYALKKDTYEGDIASKASRFELILQSITKTSFDFILLEKYTIQILVKLNNNFLIESRITRQLYDLYNLNMQLAKRELVKVFVYNSSFSSNYSWYLAVTIPFVRVFEASLLNENVLFSDENNMLTSVPSPSAQTSFSEADSDLFDKYFSRLHLPDFASYTNLSRKGLVDMHRSLASKIHPGKVNVKPLNFEYYAHSLQTIRSETFHVIQCRDFRAQIRPENHVNMLREFHRLLKQGGVLELPMLIPGVESFGTLSQSGLHPAPVHKKAIWHHEYSFECISDILEGLGSLFGPENVKFSSVLLTLKNQMNSFLLKHTAMSIHELLSDMDLFQEFAETARSLEKTDEDDLHFYFYLRAEKA